MLAEVRIKRAGKVIFREARTFTRRSLAETWAEGLEAELARPGALQAHQRTDLTVAELINRYIAWVDPIQPLGETKRACLLQIARGEPPFDMLAKILICRPRNTFEKVLVCSGYCMVTFFLKK